jgi:hypothetical protein
MSWNHRVMAHKWNKVIYFKIHQVYYDEKQNPKSYGKEGLESELIDNIKQIRWTLNKMKECLKKPILWAGDKFPEEYIKI